MQAQYVRSLLALVVALAALIVAHWFDSTVLADAQRQVGISFDPGPLLSLTSIAHLITAAGALAIGFAGWRSRNMVVGIIYVAAGAYLVFLPAMYWAVAVRVNGAPPVAPEPIATTIGQWFTTIQTGVTGSVFTLGGAMLVSGLAVLWSVLRQRGRDRTPAMAVLPTPAPEPSAP
jgi:hypothetical protein